MSNPKRILVIDNEASSLTFLVNLLKKEGYEMQKAVSGAMGLERAFVSPPDLILVDTFMPDINGYDICLKLKQSVVTKDIPIIFISALDDAGQKAKAFQYGAVDYIMKPFQSEEVLARISQQITIQRLQQQLKLQNQSLEKEVARRRITEMALKKSEGKYRVLVDSSQDVIWITDVAGIYTYVNPAAQSLYGYAPEEMIGRSWRDIVALTAPDREFVVVNSIHQGNNLTQWESLHQAKDGNLVAVLVNAVSLTDEQGNITDVTGSYTDITALKQAEEAAKLLLAATQAISSAPDVDTALGEILRLICLAINWELGEAWMPAAATPFADNPQEEVLEYRTDWCGDEQYLDSFGGVVRRKSIGFGLPRMAWAAQKSVWIEDLAADTQEIFQHSAVAIACGLRTVFAVPIIHRGQVLAILNFFRQIPSPEDPHLLELVGAVASQMGVMIAQKIAEESLLQSEEELRALFAAMQDVVLVRDRTGRCIKIASNNSVNLYQPEDTILGTTLHQVLPTTEADQILEAIQQVLATGQTATVEYGLSIQERRVWFDSTISPLDAHSVILVSRDVSDRKESELILLETAYRDRALITAIQRIRQSLDIDTIFRATVQELRQVIKCDRVLIYRFNPDWSGEFVAESIAPEWISLMQAQQQAQDLTNNALDTKDCGVTTMNPTIQAHPHYINIQDTYLQDTGGGAYTRGVSYLAVEDIYNQGFTDCYISLLEKFQAKAYLTVPIFLGDQLWGLLASYQNSSSRSWKTQEVNTVLQIGLQLGVALQQAGLLKRTQQQAADLRQAVIAADAANRAKSEFLANMSHELRTPLNAILGFTQIMNRDCNLSAEHLQYLEIINRAGSHLLDLINDVLEMSKIEAGKASLSPNAFNLKEMLTNLEAMFRLKAEHKGLDLIFKYKLDLPEFIITDEGKLRQVLINLLGNAIKFTEQGQVSLEVKHDHVPTPSSTSSISSISPAPFLATELATDNINSAPPKLGLFFSITDTGPGIAPEEIPLLFQVFRQTATGRKSQQGTGLGLPLSQQYVQMLGGNIIVQSSTQGSCFSFAIDASLTDSFLENSTPPQGEVLGLAPGQGEYRILVVDDIPENRLLVVKILGKIGFTVAEAENGLQAIGIWRAWQPHLVLMDIRMAVLDGYAAARAIRDLEEKAISSTATPSVSLAATIPATVIFALTASVFREQTQDMLAAGCDDIIIKPLQAEILLNKIAQYLKVEYIYQQSPVEVLSERLLDTKEINFIQLQSLLSQRPLEWLAQVQQAAAQGSDDLIFQLVEQIPPEQEELAIAFNDLARNFQFEKIIEIIYQV